MGKIFCYGVLLIAFLLFFQSDPIVALAILGVIMCLFLVFRMTKRRRNTGDSRFIFLSGKAQKQRNQLTDLAMVIALEQIINNSREDNYSGESSPQKHNEKKEYIEKTKQEIMELFERN